MKEGLTQLLIEPASYMLLDLFAAGVMVTTAILVAIIVAVVAPISVFISLLCIMIIE
jgi:hypothetical protein